MKKIILPVGVDTIRKLKTGDMVLLTGKIFTGRDAVHKYLYEGNKSPVDLKGQIIYHCGPVVLNGDVIAAGPTTSIREEPYLWKIIRQHGVCGVIGKGGMGERTLNAFRESGAVYFHAVGGAAQVLAKRIESVENVYLEEFGPPEAMWEFVVKDFPVLVTMDSHGNSLHEKVLKDSKLKLKKLIGDNDNG